MDLRRSGLRASLALLLSASLATAPACGGAAPAVVTTPFTAEDAIAFDHGLDRIEDPTSLGGTWLADWEADIDRRVSLSEAIALVRVNTLRTDVDLERRETYRLSATVERVRHGELPEEITLISRQRDAGFSSVRTNADRVLGQQFVLYLKWSEEEDGQILARWHLSPASDRVVRRTNSLIEQRHVPEEERRRVIVREQGSTSNAVDDEE